MADHEELVSEMSILEQMGTQERQKLAKKRRLQQLKKWAQREKEWINKERQLNKRLANILQEENNGLNLKQYTHYGSAQRSNAKKKPNNISTKNSTKQQVAKTNNNNITKESKTNVSNSLTNNGTITSNSTNSPINGNSSNGQSRLEESAIGRKELDSLSPNGRVHFNVGVMLLEAAARNDFEEVERLLRLGVSPDSINHDGLTALHQCCIDASEPMMLLLLDYGTNVDARDTERWTPLHAACTCGHLNLVKILVEHGADLLAVNGDGNMPFDVCEDETTLDYIESQMVARGITQEMIDLARASTEMQMLSDLELLVATTNSSRNSSPKKALDEPINDDGVTRLHVAAANGYISAIKFLLKHGANVNTCDNDLWRPIHGAACWGNEQHCKVVEMLVESGADLYAKTANDETVFDLCDNVELLDKLNQLKDELESRRAATGPDDRLRRTQSRTNSRVHSVRRTSVRDKNQISRREAREEALLRVESGEKVSIENHPEPKPVGKTDQLNNSVECDANSQQQRKHETNLDTFDTENKEPDKIFNTNNNMDVVDSARKEADASEASRSVAESQLNEQQTTRSESSGQSLRSQSNPVQLTNNDEALGLKSTKSDLQMSTTSENDMENSTSEKKQFDILDNRLMKDYNKPTNETLEHNSDAALQVATKRSSQGNEGLDDVNSQANCNDSNNNSNRHRINDMSEKSSTVATNCDVQSRTQQQMPLVAAQVIPMNYTLSNLKKHRSDLRMRASSQIQVNGNLSVASINHLPTLDTKSMLPNSNRSLAASPLAPGDELGEPSLNPDGDGITVSSNGHNIDQRGERKKGATSRAESPGSTFRKFHGEASDAIDIGRTTGHKCCILI